MKRLRRLTRSAPLLLALILVTGLALRLWHNDYGLPYIWGIDEGTHFASRAVDMFRGGFDPGYYQNPAGYTYLLYGLLRLIYGQLGLQLAFGNVSDQFNKDPTAIWVAARTLAAVLCMVGVAATYSAARRLWGVREGLVAAALLAFAFLPVAYSRIAVTDVGSLTGVALAIWGSLRVAEEGRARDYLLAGAGAGLALGFKYTAGLALLPFGIAAASRLRADRGRAALLLAGGVALACVVFAALNPYLFTNFDRFLEDLRGQAAVAANEPKPGQQSGGIGYYLDSLGWGLGWVAAFAALAGAVLELRRGLARGLVLVSMPLVLFVYLAVQSRYFGRWLLPAYPVLAMLGAVALVQASELVRARPVARAAVLAGLTALALAQPLAADVRSGLVLGREDTREQVRNFLAHRYPPELRVSVEPAVPLRWYRSTPRGRNPPWLRRCPRQPGWTERGWRYPSQGGKLVCAQYKPGQFARPDGGVRASAYHLVLRPRVIDDYRFYGYCLVVTYGVVSERALDTGDPAVRAYYRRLRSESEWVRTFSPYDRGAKPVPFSFDLSYNYYPSAYDRPGPVARVYRLRNCRQAYGASVVKVPRARERPPFAPPRKQPGNPQDEI